MTSTLSFTVVGQPASQGSKRHVGHGVMVESSKKLAPWRQDVVAAALRARRHTGHATFVDAVWVVVCFYLPRPRSHFRTGKHSQLLRDAAPPYPIARTLDIDKAARATLDPLVTAGVLTDDALVVDLHATKRYIELGDDALPGAHITVADHDPTWDQDDSCTGPARHVEDVPIQGALL